jgi:hypothetical protein
MNSDAPLPLPEDPTQLDDWSTISNDLLQGLIHALNNRVAALGAFLELARLGHAVDPVAELPGEITQLQGVSALFALLPEGRTQAEALELPAALDDAIRLHEHHPGLRAERCEVRYEGTAIPVRAQRSALMRTLVMLIHAAKRDKRVVEGRGAASVVVRADESTMSVRVSASAAASRDLTAAAERAGGAVTREDHALVFRLPSLAELRRREREAGAARD